ncbi:reverse transcriptase N-terminal domain-containing protein, partial [Saccharopolyspora elongata]
MTGTTADAAIRVTKSLDDAEAWRSVNWAEAEADVRRLRQRIFKAAQDGDAKRLHNLQKLMLRSRHNTVVSIRRVTQLSQGRRTPGVDGKVALSDQDRGQLLRGLEAAPRCQPMPVRRVHIPKANGKLRPLGIPTIRDRVEQARVKNALEPEWEALFEERSYGFRPGRSCHDAVGRIHTTMSRKDSKRTWVLDADLSSAFDRVNHDRLLEAIGDFPARREIQGWLTAGVMEQGRYAPTEEGTPQGG